MCIVKSYIQLTDEETMDNAWLTQNLTRSQNKMEINLQLKNRQFYFVEIAVKVEVLESVLGTAPEGYTVIHLRYNLLFKTIQIRYNTNLSENFIIIQTYVSIHQIETTL